MVEHRRSEMDIISDILKITKGGARRTEILYSCKLSYTQLQNYLAYLVEKEILDETKVKNGNGMSKVYTATEKGDQLLACLTKTLQFL